MDKYEIREIVERELRLVSNRNKLWHQYIPEISRNISTKIEDAQKKEEL